MLLAVVLLGGAVAPAAHWASHGLEDHGAAHTHCPHGHDAHDQGPMVSEESADEHFGSCPDCAFLQKVMGAEATTQPFYAEIVGLERSVPVPEAPATETDVVVPGERGPPQVG
ncbi:MAG: DUF2946 family protein [Bacteroidota bacterium]